MRPDIPWLLVLFWPELTLAWADRDIGPGFLARDELFETIAEDDITGFYDRLYAPNGDFVGLQITPLATPSLPQMLAHLPYVRSVESHRQLRIFLTGRSPDPISEIIDQAFGGRIYRSFDNTYAISLDTYFLREHERLLIAAGPARWETIRPTAS
ncbi:MAG: hypothetical protein ACJ796_20430 [Gemmatimonadaceae bacterium]